MQKNFGLEILLLVLRCSANFTFHIDEDWFLFISIHYLVDYSLLRYITRGAALHTNIEYFFPMSSKASVY